MSENSLTIRNLSKRFGVQPVIENLSLAIRKNERFVILAPSGSGKSTLINILAGLENCDNGGFNFNGLKPATIFQEARLFNYMTVEENILLPLHIQKRALTPEIKKEYDRWLEVCDLASFKQFFPFQLSGGMKQKVNLVRCFLSRPEFVLMDEPFQSINYQSKIRIIEHLKKTNPGITLLMATHNMDEIPLLAHACLIFESTPLRHYRRIEASAFRAPAPAIASDGKEITSANPFFLQENNPFPMLSTERFR